MKVKDVIEFLSKCDPEREVVCFDADAKKMELVHLEGLKDDGGRVVVRTRLGAR